MTTEVTLGDETIDMGDPFDAFGTVVLALSLTLVIVAWEAVKQKPIEMAGRILRTLWWLLNHADEAVELIQGVL